MFSRNEDSARGRNYLYGKCLRPHRTILLRNDAFPDSERAIVDRLSGLRGGI